jgi:hypothetical protein
MPTTDNNEEEEKKKPRNQKKTRNDKGAERSTSTRLSSIWREETLKSLVLATIAPEHGHKTNGHEGGTPSTTIWEA